MLIYPFRGILYNKKKIKDLAKVYSSPYDIISTNQQDEYYKKSPYNVIRLELNRVEKGDNEQNNTYTRSAGFLNEWLDKGVLEQDEKSAIYVYGQSFQHNNKTRNTLGFIAAAKIEKSRHRRVMPHEMTFKAPKEDREKVLEIVGANLSCIYTLVEDEGLNINNLLRKISKGKVFIDVKADGVRHRIWKLDDEKLINKLQDIMSDKAVFIADGHHRYEAAANFRDKKALPLNENHPANYVMMYFASLQDKDLTILATHRVVKDLSAPILDGLSRYFDVMSAPNIKKMFEVLDKYFGKEHAFGLYTGNGFSVLRLKDKKSKEKLDVAILHNLILSGVKDIYYTRDPMEAVRLVRDKKYKAAFFLNPTLASQIKDTSLAGEKMPHKSTYFYPKLLTGLVMRLLNGERNV